MKRFSRLMELRLLVGLNENMERLWAQTLHDERIRIIKLTMSKDLPLTSDWLISAISPTTRSYLSLGSCIELEKLSRPTESFYEMYLRAHYVLRTIWEDTPLNDNMEIKDNLNVGRNMLKVYDIYIEEGIGLVQKHFSAIKGDICYNLIMELFTHTAFLWSVVFDTAKADNRSKHLLFTEEPLPDPGLGDITPTMLSKSIVEPTPLEII